MLAVTTNDSKKKKNKKRKKKKKVTNEKGPIWYCKQIQWFARCINVTTVWGTPATQLYWSRQEGLGPDFCLAGKNTPLFANPSSFAFKGLPGH
jgi:hypothetical protein